MEVDVMTAGLPLRQAQALASDAANAGFSGVVVTEAGRSAYLTCAAVALAAPVDVLTGVAVAFPRSPMVTAQLAWELAEATHGRFRLGLGTQVRAHVERRFGVPFDPPGPRLRDHVLAVRAVFRAFAGEAPLDFHGRFHDLTLLPRAWSPGPIEYPAPPIDVAAVNPWMLRMAGEVADGVHVHPLNTTTYLHTTVKPEVAAGERATGREPGTVRLIVPVFVAPGETEGEQKPWWELARNQVAFYGSTPNYAFVFEQLGREGITERLRERQKAGDLAGMAAVIDDDLLAEFCTAGSWGELPAKLRYRYQDIADRLVLYPAGIAWSQDRAALARWGEVARALRAAA